MLLRQLEYLQALAREQHFGRAADACHVSQPALSNGIARLEAELGLGLVRRGRQFDGLTEQGAALLQWAQAALGAVQGLTQEASELRGGLAGTLRLGTIPTATARIGRVLGPFLQEQPGIRLSVTSRPAAELVAGLHEHRLDAALMYLDEPADTSLHQVPLYRERLVLLTTQTLPSPERTSVTWAEAAALPLCLLAPTMHSRQIVDRAFRAAGATAELRAEADSVVALLELAAAGLSCIVADPWLEHRPLPPGARAYDLTSPTVSPTVGLVSAKGALTSPAVRALRERVPRLA